MKLAEAIKRAVRVYIVGNGGSYANSVHICNDLLSCGIKAYTLDPATLTAIANDYGYENVFSRWLATVGEAGDLLIALSGSGRSQNIINAITEAENLGMETWAILGNRPGEAFELANMSMVQGEGMQAAEDAQIMIGHEVMKCLRNS